MFIKPFKVLFIHCQPLVPVHCVHTVFYKATFVSRTWLLSCIVAVQCHGLVVILMDMLQITVVQEM